MMSYGSEPGAALSRTRRHRLTKTFVIQLCAVLALASLTAAGGKAPVFRTAEELNVPNQLPAEIVRRFGGTPPPGAPETVEEMRAEWERLQKEDGLKRAKVEIDADPVIYSEFHSEEKVIDEGDAYYVNGELTGLLRSTEEFGVVMDGRTARTPGDLARAMAPQYRLTVFESIEPELMELVNIRADQRMRLPVGSELEAIRSTAGVAYAYPVYLRAEDRFRLLATDRYLVSFGEGGRSGEFDKLAGKFGLVEEVDEMSIAGDYRVFRTQKPNKVDPLALSRWLHEADGVEWAEPKWVMQIQLHAPPNDPFFNIQWEHQNLGLNGSLADADPDTLEAWELGYGSPDAIVAVADSGFQTAHPDLEANMWVNDDPAGGGDDDGNGFTDDTRGWDFFSNDNNVNPTSAEGHGMGSAGIVAAVINNSTGPSGTSNAKIMGLRITNDSSFTTNTNIANAINYAWQNGAWVQSHSWGTPGSGSASTAVDNAIANSVANGRNGLGTPVFVATGNNASFWNSGGGPLRLYPGFAPGSSLYLALIVERTAAGSGGNNRAGFDNVIHVDGTRYDFESGMPGDNLGALLGGSPMQLITTGAQTATISTQSLASPSLGANGAADAVFTPRTAVADHEGQVYVQTSLFADGGSGTSATVYFFDGGSGSGLGGYTFSGQRPFVNTNAGWPASNGNSVAVGSSTDWDDRSDYSQFGSQLDFVVSSNGGWQPTFSLDSTGGNGWSPTSYKDFGGTSSACPKAAAIAALVLSRYPELTATELRTVMRQTADKVHAGAVYIYNSSGFNNEVGYGRLNANRAVQFAGPSFGDSDSMMFTMAGDGMQTLSNDPLEVLIGVRADHDVLLLSFFDGDSGGGSGGWTGGQWDYSTQSVTYALFADPNKTGVGMTFLTSFASAGMSDNEWDLFTRSLDASAQNANGNYYYRLIATPASWSGTWVNSFKLGVNGQLSVPAGVFLYQNALYTVGDLDDVYPNFVDADNPGASAMDTTLRLFPYYPVAPAAMTVWDGDFDFGALNWGSGASAPTVTDPDTDDPNTFPFDFVPGTGVVSGEGQHSGTVVKNGTQYTLMGVGNPPDNERRAFRQVNPSTGNNVTYSVQLPGVAGTFWNMNPSGNGEWERFTVATGVDPTADIQGVGSSASGFGEIEVSGLDWSNIVGLSFDTEVFFSDDETPYGGVVSP